MLVPAITRVEELNSKFAKTALDPFYKFYHLSYVDLEIRFEDSFWKKVQLVSLNKSGDVCGYFNAMWSRPEDTIDSLKIISFDKKNPMVFAKDLINFFKYLLFDLNAKKINFATVIKNPASPRYDSIVKRLGGRVVGIKKYDYMINNEYYDVKMYEILNDYWKCDNCDYRPKTK